MRFSAVAWTRVRCPGAVASEIAPVALRRVRASARSFVSAGNLATFVVFMPDFTSGFARSARVRAIVVLCDATEKFCFAVNERRQRSGCCGHSGRARRGESNPNARRRTAGPTGSDTGQPSSRKTLSLVRQVQGTVTHSGRGEFWGNPKPAHSPWGDAPRSSPNFRVPQNAGSRSSDTSQNQAPAEAERSPESAPGPSDPPYCRGSPRARFNLRPG